jgi:hypothetical protein
MQKDTKFRIFILKNRAKQNLFSYWNLVKTKNQVFYQRRPALNFYVYYVAFDRLALVDTFQLLSTLSSF